MNNLRIEHRPNGIFLVCDRGEVAKMTAGYGDTQQKDADELVRLYNLNQQRINSGKCRSRSRFPSLDAMCGVENER